MTLSTLKRITTNYSFRIPVFDSPNWGHDMEANFDTIDAVLFAVTGYANIRGIWEYEIAYSVNDRVIDPADGSLWECQVAHTSINEGTMNDDRTTNPTYWSQLTLLPSYRGAWATATAYVAYQFLYDGARFGVTTRTFTSSGSYNTDVTNGDIVTLVDLSAYVIPNPTVALNYIRANAGATAYELRTPAQVRADIGADNASNLVSGTVPYARVPDEVDGGKWTNTDTVTDWDTLTSPGWEPDVYRGSNTNGPGGTIWYRPLIMSGQGTITQLAIPIQPNNNNTKIHMRTYTGGAWFAWQEWLSNYELATIYASLTANQTISGDLTLSGTNIHTGTQDFQNAITGTSGTFSGSVTATGNHNIKAANATANAHCYFRDDTSVQRALIYWSYNNDRIYFQLYDNAGSPTGSSLYFDGADLVLNTGTVAFLRQNGNQNLTGGYTSTAHNQGTIASGTYTPDPANGNLQRAVNGGAHTLAAPTASGDYSITIQYTNNASAGAVTLSGFTKTDGDTLTTVNGDDFFLHIIKINGFTRLTVEALQ